MKFLKLLLLPFLFFACQSKDCPIPVCPPPVIYDGANVVIKFETGLSNSFPTAELEEVFFTTKDKYTNDIISVDTISNLIETDYQIRIGGEGYLMFDTESNDGNSSGFGNYFHEVEIPNAERSYKIDQFEFQYNTKDPCDCPFYIFKSVEINDSIFLIKSEPLILKK